MGHLQASTSYPNVTAHISLAAYHMVEFDSEKQTQFGQQVLNHFNASSGDVLVNITNPKEGSVEFDFAAIFANGNENQAQELGGIFLVRLFLPCLALLNASDAAWYGAALFP